ncbi:MAG: tyrosine-type recombinase/integrase [Proteobacteria bacterium]|nr:tyrosine-type recombinase/integrase [Pseudomonadota bacterium]
MTNELVAQPGARLLTAEQFQRLADVPTEIEWLANLGSKCTRRAYDEAIRDFMRFTGIAAPGEFRLVGRAHVIAWRDALIGRRLSPASVRHRLAALSSLFEYLCECNSVTNNPVKGVKRPAVETSVGKTPALGDHQAAALLSAPTGESVKSKRDRAILATLLYHALRREELCKLRVRDVGTMRRGIAHITVSGKGGKTRYVPLHPAAASLIADYLEGAGHGADADGGLFRATQAQRTTPGNRALTPDAVYKLVRRYTGDLGFIVGAHSLRATAATNALDNGADIAKVQEWLGHANIATTRIYDHRRTRPEDSPTYKVLYG